MKRYLIFAALALSLVISPAVFGQSCTEGQIQVEGGIKFVCSHGVWKEKENPWAQVKQRSTGCSEEGIDFPKCPKHETPLTDEEIRRMRQIIELLTCKPHDISYDGKPFCINFDGVTP